MTAKATIQLHLPHDDDEEWKQFGSERVELAGFTWHVTGEYRDSSTTISLSKTQIHCTNSATSIWNCEACGQIVAYASFPVTQRSQLWSSVFDFRYLQNSADLKLKAFWNFPRHTNVIFTEREDELQKSYFKVEVHLEVTNHTLVDLSNPNNSMILSADDAAPVDVEGKKLWLSKSLLGVHSPFFKALFNSDFKEKLTGVYELKEIKLDNLCTSFRLIYGTHIEFEDASMTFILELADYFQCDLVINRCRSFLRQTNRISLEERLNLMQRYGFFSLVSDVIEQMSAQQLKIFMEDNGGRDLNSFTQQCVTKRLLNLLKV